MKIFEDLNFSIHQSQTVRLKRPNTFPGCETFGVILELLESHATLLMGRCGRYRPYWAGCSSKVDILFWVRSVAEHKFIQMTLKLSEISSEQHTCIYTNIPKLHTCNCCQICYIGNMVGLLQITTKCKKDYSTERHFFFIFRKITQKILPNSSIVLSRHVVDTVGKPPSQMFCKILDQCAKFIFFNLI